MQLTNFKHKIQSHNKDHLRYLWNKYMTQMLTISDLKIDLVKRLTYENNIIIIELINDYDTKIETLESKIDIIIERIG